jgi:ribonuclease J
VEVRPGSKVRERIGGERQTQSGPPRPDVLALTPLGGVGEIGKNLTVIEYGGKALVVDCGLRFPNVADHPGVDLIIPDFSYLRQLGGAVTGVVLTHGHEDHIGALAFLLKERPLNIFGTRFTLALASGRLQELGVIDRAKLVEVKAGGKLGIGPFEIGFFNVCHSVADGVGLVIKTPLGTIVHTGDFKIDADPVDGKKLDTDFLRKIGDEGVLALFSDSTNVERAGETLSERSVYPAIEQAFMDAPKRVICTSFASHVHRFQQLLWAAEAAGRKVSTLGRSMGGNMGLAQELGYLKVPDRIWVDLDTALSLPPKKCVLISTGSQGEPRSGLARLADGTHTDLKVEQGDLLVYSARSIPGNERLVGKMFDNFYRRGADVLTERQARVHVSGHGAREDLRVMMQLLRPRFLIPGHGERRHQVLHQRLAYEEGITADRVFLLDNGQRWTFDGKTAGAAHYVMAGEVLVDGLAMGETGDLVLRDRQHLREDGLVVCSVGLSRLGEVLNGPHLMVRGLMLGTDPAAMKEGAIQAVNVALREQVDTGSDLDEAMARDVIATALKRYFKKKLQARPMVVPAVMEV